MNELSTTTKQLPDTLNDLSRFVLIGREKLTAVRAEIRAIDKVGLAREVHEQKLAEAQEIAEAVTDAEVRIGELLKAIPKATPNNNPYHEFVPNDNLVKPKTEVIQDLGFTPKQTAHFQQMANHPEAVAKAKAEAREDGRVLSRNDVMKQITYGKQLETIENSGDSELIDSVKSGDISINQAYRTVKGIKSTSPQQAKKQFEKELHERRNDFGEKKQSGVVDFKSVQQEKEDRDYAVKSLWLDMLKMGSGIDGMYLKHKFKEIDIVEMAKHIKHEDLEDLIKTMKRWMSEVEQMIVIMEGQN